MMKLFNGFGPIGSVFDENLWFFEEIIKIIERQGHVLVIFGNFLFQTAQRCPYFFASRLYAQYKAGFQINALSGSYWP